jgi:glucan phosphoethanolaminetransferase (alkaline phosphatase superfamily)
MMAMQVLREATPEEFHNYLPALSIGGAGSLVILVCYWQLGKRCTSNTLRMPTAVNAIGIALLLLTLSKDVVGSGLRSGGQILLQRLEHLQPVAPVFLEAHVLLGGATVPDRAAILRRYQVVQTPARADRQICVLVIGESARRNAFGIYNPAIPTTPLLQKRYPIVFTDTTACATVTFQSLPAILTGRLPQKGEMLPFNALDLIEAFRIAGFNTAWLSTQPADGEMSSFVTSFSENAATKKFVNGRMEHSQFRQFVEKNDDALLAPLDELLAQGGPRLFVVLHTYGSHASYIHRYPASFEKWPVDPAAKSSMWRWLPPYSAYQREQIDNAYFDTIYFTDWFLDQVIARLEKSGAYASVCYMSDHGENDAGAKILPAAHGNLSPDVVDVPFLAWLSSRYRAAEPEIVRALESNREKKSSAQDVFPTLCEMYHLASSEVDPTRSLADDHYEEHPRFVLQMDGTISPIGPEQTSQ